MKTRKKPGTLPILKWMGAKRASGLKLGKAIEVDPLRNVYLVEWEQLPDGIKQIDRDMVRGIPRILSNAGYAVEKTSK